jgi:hypothetical protein
MQGENPWDGELCLLGVKWVFYNLRRRKLLQAE